MQEVVIKTNKILWQKQQCQQIPRGGHNTTFSVENISV
jgi:hypothetical protein